MIERDWKRRKEKENEMVGADRDRLTKEKKEKGKRK